MVADAELCKEVGIKKFKDIKNRSSPQPTVGSSLLHEALFLARDALWSSMRNALTPLYQPARLASHIPSMQSYVNSLLLNVSAAQEQEEYVPFCQLTLRMAIDIIGKIAFGVEFGVSDQLNHGRFDDREISEFLDEHRQSIEYLKMDLSSSFSNILGLFAPILQKPCKALFKHIPGLLDYNMHQNELKLCRRIDSLIVRRLREKTRESEDLLAVLLNAEETGITKELFAHNNIRALTYEHLVAGTKTTAFTISTAVYLVSEHPEVEEKLIQEIDSHGPRDRIPTADDLQNKFPYLDQVIKEAMRYYTVSPLIARETSQEVEIGGYHLPKGTHVWLAIGVLAKDPNQFLEPNAFRPERFDPEGDEEKQRHPYAHIPFGIGPRACLGQRFALQEIKLAIIYLYRHYVFRHSLHMERPLEFKYDLILGFKHGVKLVAYKRLP